MQKEQVICQKCAKKVAADQAILHAVRIGYSPKHFPLMHYEKTNLCIGCYRHQQKIDLFEKVVAVFALVIVIYFMVMGLIFLFSR